MKISFRSAIDYFKGVRLQKKFFYFFSGLVLLILIFVSSTIYFVQKQTLLKNARDKAFNLTGILAYSSVYAIMSDDYLSLQSLIDSMNNNPDILSITIIDTTGKIIVSDIPEKRGIMLDDPLTKEALLSETYLVQHVPSESGEEIWDTAVPIYELNKRRGTARIKISVEDTYKGLLFSIVGIGIVAILISVVLSFKLSRSISKPITEAVNLAGEYGRGNLDATISIYRKDEIGDLIKSLNKLSDELKSMIEEKIGNENLVMMGEFASFIIHDLKNPISGIHLLAEGLDRKIAENESIKKYSTEILIASQKLEDFVKKTLDIARSTSPDLQYLNIHELIETVLSEIHLDSIPVEKIYDAEVKDIYADYNLLFRAVKNIILNAVEAITGEGEIKIETRWQDKLILKITDTGAGIAANRLKTIFRPFYSMKKQGHGLGLAMAKKAVIMHRGTIEVQSEEGLGSTFIITLPLMKTHHINQLKEN